MYETSPSLCSIGGQHMSPNGSKLWPSYKLDFDISADQMGSGSGPLVRGAFPPIDGMCVASSHRRRQASWFSNILKVDSDHPSPQFICNLAYLSCHMGYDMGLRSGPAMLAITWAVLLVLFWLLTVGFTQGPAILAIECVSSLGVLFPRPVTDVVSAFWVTVGRSSQSRETSFRSWSS